MRKIKYSRFFILGVIIYILFQGVLLLIGVRTSTLVIKAGDYEIKSKEKCLIIRDEYLVKSDTSGRLSILVNENDKVKKSSKVAIISNDEVDDNIGEQINNLNKEIKDLKKENNPLKSGILKSKEEQLKILQKQVEKNTSVFCASTPGVVSFLYDGDEEKYNISSLEDLSKEDINNVENNYISVIKDKNSVKSGSVIFRMINNDDIYIAFVNEDNQLSNQGDSVKIKINKEEINGEIYKVCKKDDYFITIIKITQQNTGIYDTREEVFDIIYKQMESLRIPKESLVTRNEKTGVFVVNEETKKPYFQEIKGICFEDDKYIYVDFRSNKNNGINTVDINDRIISKPNIINENIKIVN